MKVEVTHASIVNDMGVVASVELVDDVTVKVNINQYIGWNDWVDLTDAVRRVMMMMEIEHTSQAPVPSVERSGKYRVKKAREEEREACAKLAEQTVCDTHLPTGVKIYGSRVAEAIRARSNT